VAWKFLVFDNSSHGFESFNWPPSTYPGGGFDPAPAPLGQGMGLGRKNSPSPALNGQGAGAGEFRQYAGINHFFFWTRKLSIYFLKASKFPPARQL